MRGHTRSKLLAVICIAAAALTASRGGAENAAPPAPAPAAAAGTTQGKGCDTDAKPHSAGGASVVPATGESLPRTRWQPTGGEIQFTVKSFDVIPHDASVIVCFRWKTVPSKVSTAFIAPPPSPFIPTRPTQLDLSSDEKLLKVTTTVPYDLELEPQPPDVAKALYLVPLAKVRILAIDNNGGTAVDVTTNIAQSAGD